MSVMYGHYDDDDDDYCNGLPSPGKSGNEDNEKQGQVEMSLLKPDDREKQEQHKAQH